MSEKILFDERLFPSWKKTIGGSFTEDISPKKSFSDEFLREVHGSEESARPSGNWCEAFSSSLSNVNAKQAWKNGTEKLSQTFNSVRTTFGVLSRRIKKSTRKRQPLVNVDSPVTPYTRSKAALGRTPTKLYSPFTIDTPKGKENIISHRFIRNETNLVDSNMKGGKGKRKLKRTKLDLGGAVTDTNNMKELVLSNSVLQTQVGIYEFQSVANRIIQSNLNN